MRVPVALSMFILCAGTAAADQLTSPYRPDARAELRGLDAREIADLRTGAGMGLARAAELNSYPGPRHILDAVEAGRLQASAEQIARVRQIFTEMRADAQRIGGEILLEEHHLEAAFRAATINDSDLRARVDRIAALQGRLRAVHLRAHLATRAVLSEAQVARYNEIRGYGAGSPSPHGPHAH